MTTLFLILKYIAAFAVQLLGAAFIGIMVLAVDYAGTCVQKHEYKELPSALIMAVVGLVFGFALLYGGTVWHENIHKAAQTREHGCVCGGVCPCHKEAKHAEGH